jgi:REP element-mobilizing transposase RayT
MPYARKDTLIWQRGMHYHIYNRGARQVTIFREPTNYLFTISKLKKYSQAKGISILAYCLMPNHYHLLIRQDGEEAAGDLPQLVFNSYSKAYNKMYSHSGTLFEGRFRAKVIQTTSHLLHLCRYIHSNPVKDGIVAEPDDWPYSNYLEWIEERQGTLIDRNFVKEQFSHSAEYKKFLSDYLNTLRLPDGVQNQINEIEK